MNSCDKRHWLMQLGKRVQVETLYRGNHPSWEAATRAYWMKP